MRVAFAILAFLPVRERTADPGLARVDVPARARRPDLERDLGFLHPHFFRLATFSSPSAGTSVLSLLAVLAAVVAVTLFAEVLRRHQLAVQLAEPFPELVRILDARFRDFFEVVVVDRATPVGEERERRIVREAEVAALLRLLDAVGKGRHVLFPLVVVGVDGRMPDEESGGDDGASVGR